jgi:HEAT repeat protein
MDGLLQALADLKDPRVLPLLVEAARQGPVPRRVTAAALLSSYEAAAARDVLRFVTKDPSPELKREAWHSLWLGGDPEAIPRLRLLLRSGEAVDRRIAATLLGEIGDGVAASDLSGALAHETDDRVALDMAHGLAKLDRPETSEVVVKALEREMQPMPSLAILANNVASALLLYSEISEPARLELARIAGSQLASRRLNALRVLMKHGSGDACREAILAAMADAEPGIREIAARAWLRFPGAGVAPLLEMLENETQVARARTIVDIAKRLAHRWEE